MIDNEILNDACRILDNVQTMLGETLRDSNIPILIRADILNNSNNLGRTIYIGDLLYKEFLPPELTNERFYFTVQDLVEVISNTTDEILLDEYYYALEQMVLSGIRLVETIKFI